MNQIKRPKLIIACYLMLQSLGFFIAFLVSAAKNKKLSTVFATIAGVGVIGGAGLLYADYRERKAAGDVYDNLDEIDEDFCDLDADDDDIVCSFEGDLPEEDE